MNVQKLKDSVRNISNFPIEGIEFKDITTLFQSPECLKELSDVLYEKYKDKIIYKDKIVEVIKEVEKQISLDDEIDGDVTVKGNLLVTGSLNVTGGVACLAIDNSNKDK